MFVLAKVLCPPIAKSVHYWFRRSKFRKLQTALYNHFTPQFWGDKGDNQSIRLGCSEANYQLAYFDFIDFRRNSKNWLGLKLPMPILIAGSGTFNDPYTLDFV